MKFRRAQLESADHEALIRLCIWLGIDGNTDWERSSLINWLIYMDYCWDPNPNMGMWLR